jgi:hypothetical protein
VPVLPRRLAERRLEQPGEVRGVGEAPAGRGDRRGPEVGVGEVFLDVVLDLLEQGRGEPRASAARTSASTPAPRSMLVEALRGIGSTG